MASTRRSSLRPISCAGERRTTPATGVSRTIVDVVAAPEAPFRLLLGSDAITGVEAELDTQREEIRAWEEISRSTDFSG
ncbi:hypothetical protein [Nonomuraea zeae]|uniref:hypothetical protein n=1 Tax=Nonomuraea zeae TaxID=1642303 RepID=UPI00110B0115